MLDFLRLASRNLIKATAIVFAVFLIMLAGIALALVLFKDKISTPDWNDIFLGISFNFGLTLFIMILAFFSEYREYAAFRYVFSKRPFNELSSLGFREVKLFNQRFPWKLYKPVMLAQAGGYLIVAETKSRSRLTISYLAWNVKGVSFTNEIENHRGIRLASADYGVSMVIPVESFQTPAIAGLNHLLTGVVPFIRSKGYTPMHDLTVYEKVFRREMIQQGFSGA